MPLIFYYGSGSPYAWRVWLALEHKGIDYELRTMSFSAGDLRKPEFRAVNPRGKLPAITDGDFALYESVAIVEYLDEQYGGPRVFPLDVRERARVRRLVQEADQYYAVAMDRLVDEVLFKPQDQWEQARIDAARESLVQELATWERLVAGPWLAGDTVSAADFTLYPLIALTLRMQKRKPDLDVRAAVGPVLGAWMQRVEALPILRKTWPPHWK
jgi:glutathione S-transferase